MSLTEQEQKCIDLAHSHLAETYGGIWTVESDLDEEHQSRPTPEVISTNGDKSAAIEVKQLTGDRMQREFEERQLSDETYLTPSCGGYYSLYSPANIRIHGNKKLRRRVKREIDRVAPSLAPEEVDMVLVPRVGRISPMSGSGAPYVHCGHMGPFHPLAQRLGERTGGRFMLVDHQNSMACTCLDSHFSGLDCFKGLDCFRAHSPVALISRPSLRRRSSNHIWNQ